jgi:hypothetical protein
MRCVGRRNRGQRADARSCDKVHVVQFAVDRRLAGRSSWLAVAREKALRARSAEHVAGA